jgi:glycosyltransferase involved in cell wall biosynthesis
MNIVIDVRPLMGGKWSGVETYIYHLIKHISKLNLENNYILFANAKNDQQKYIPDFGRKNIQIIQTHIPNKILNFGLLFFKYPKLDKFLEKKLHLKIDLWVFPDLRPYALSKNTASIQTVHDLCFERFPQFFSAKSRLWFKLLQPKKLISRADKIIAVSHSTKEDLENIYQIPKEKIEVVYEGIDEEFSSRMNELSWINIKNKYKLPHDYFLFLSTLEPRKNLKNLLLAFEEYKKRNNNQTKLVLVGQEQSEIFSKLHIPDSTDIIQTGFISEDEKPYFYKHAKALIYPSFFEGFGLPLLEAMKCGTPIITSNSSSMPEIAGGSAIYIDPNDTHTIVTAMEKIEDTTQSKKLTDNSRIQIKKFNWDECAKSTLKLIKETIENKKR